MWGFMGKTPRVSSNGMLAVLGGSYYNVLPFIGGLALAVGVIMGKFAPPEGMTGDGLYAFFTINHMSVPLGVIVIVGLLMTVISCGSSFAMNGVTILTNDIYLKVMKKNSKPTDKQTVAASRTSLIVVMAIGIASALWLPILVPLWSLAQAIVISGLLCCTLGAWFWKRSTTAGALSSTIIGGVAAFAWAMYAWIETGSPGSIVPALGTNLHAVHVGLVFAIPVFIIVSLATKPEYEKAITMSYKTLGEELKTTNLVTDKQTRPGLFGWLGADTVTWKVYWVIVFTVFALHYLLSFFFHVHFVGLTMVWISIVIGFAMIVLLAVLGGRDLAGLFRLSSKANTTDKVS
jgi:SSS family solute:Na+ symporter